MCSYFKIQWNRYNGTESLRRSSDKCRDGNNRHRVAYCPGFHEVCTSVSFERVATRVLIKASVGWCFNEVTLPVKHSRGPPSYAVAFASSSFVSRPPSLYPVNIARSFCLSFSFVHFAGVHCPGHTQWPHSRRFVAVKPPSLTPVRAKSHVGALLSAIAEITHRKTIDDRNLISRLCSVSCACDSNLKLLDDSLLNSASSFLEQ